MSRKLTEQVDRFGIPLLEMAFDRSSFQNKIAEKLVGALGEYAFVELAKKNGQKRWVAHKQTEVDLLFQMLGFMDLPTKGRFDKKKAALEIVAHYQDNLSGFVTRARNAYQVYYKKKSVQKIGTADLIPLLQRAEGMIRSS